jgi:hypothetical protein
MTKRRRSIASMRKPSDTSAVDRVLVILLRACAVMMGLALFAAFLPRPWMAAIHGWLGLGPFPEGPIVDYLARSLSLAYALCGGLLWVISADLHRYSSLLVYMAWAGIAFGAAMLGIDMHAGMPLDWTCCEGPFVILVNSVVLGLVLRVRREEAKRGQGEGASDSTAASAR